MEDTRHKSTGMMHLIYVPLNIEAERKTLEEIPNYLLKVILYVDDSTVSTSCCVSICSTLRCPARGSVRPN